MTIEEQIKNSQNLLLIYGAIESFYNVLKDRFKHETKDYILAFISQMLDEIEASK